MRYKIKPFGIIQLIISLILGLTGLIDWWIIGLIWLMDIKMEF